MFYYAGFYLLTSLLFVLSQIQRSKAILYLVLLIAFFFSAFRYDAGYDFFNYLQLIKYETGASFERLEPLNKIIINYSRSLDFPHLYYIVTSFIYVLFMALGFREFKSISVITISSMLFFIGAYLTSFDIIRQMVAVSLVFYSLSLLINKKIIIGLLFFTLAVGFHKSSLLLIGIYIYFILINSKKYPIIFYLIAIIVAYFSTGLLVLIGDYTGLYQGYFTKGGNDTGILIYIMLLIYTASLLFFASICKTITTKFWLFFNLFFLGILIYTALLQYGYFATRISYFLFPFGFLAWDELIKSTSKNKIFLSIYNYAFSSVVFISMLIISSGSERAPLLNYTFYFMS